MSMPTDLLQQNIAPLLGIDILPEEEQAVFLMDIGDLIMESSLLRLVAEFSDDQEEALNHYLETNPDPAVLLDYLLTHYATFKKIIEEEIFAFKAEAVEIFGKTTT